MSDMPVNYRRDGEWIMSNWVVYDHPRDYPNYYVLRRWDILRGVGGVPTSEVYLAETLDDIRDFVPQGCTPLHREAADDASIVEVWI
jgi:hypothetical protein